MIWHGNILASARELRTRREPAQALVVAGLLLGLVLLPVIGLGVDAELIFSAHRRLEMLADGAARVGAMQLDPAATYARQQASLDTRQAESAAEAYLQQSAGVTATVTAQADVDHIQVRAERDVELGFGQFWGHSHQHLVATAAAAPCEGIAEATSSC
jgi:hypothetical protein